MVIKHSDDVAAATFRGKRPTSTRAGTTSTPPPTPKNPLAAPDSSANVATAAVRAVDHGAVVDVVAVAVAVDVGVDVDDDRAKRLRNRTSTAIPIISAAKPKSSTPSLARAASTLASTEPSTSGGSSRKARSRRASPLFAEINDDAALVAITLASESPTAAFGVATPKNTKNGTRNTPPPTPSKPPKKPVTKLPTATRTARPISSRDGSTATWTECSRTSTRTT